MGLRLTCCGKHTFSKNGRRKNIRLGCSPEIIVETLILLCKLPLALCTVCFLEILFLNVDYHQKMFFIRYATELETLDLIINKIKKNQYR